MSFARFLLLAALVLAIQIVAPSRAVAAPVLMISIDGLRADDLTSPDAHALKIPNLRALVARGAAASGVRGVLPTVTYPSHTTMITGVYPSKHGIAANVAFDPAGGNMSGWMWYAQDIRVPTLWDTVKARGGRVASIGWPVSVGKREIDYHVPEYWRAKVPEDEKLLRALSTPGLPEEMERLTGVPFAEVALDRDELHSGMDDARMAWVAAIIARYKPQLTTLHLVSLDGARHKFGPYSAEARVTLENIDRGLGRLIESVRAADPTLVIAVVSDHGFLPIEKGFNLSAALAAEGFLQFGANGGVAEWSAVPWVMGGSAAVILKDPQDKVLEAQVRQVLTKLAADPANGIERVLERADIARLGGTSRASFWISMKSGFSVVGSANKALVGSVATRGTHGYSPDNDAMLSAFVLAGPGIVHQQLGIIDMRDIAPTIGTVLGAPLPQYDGKVIPVRRAAN